LEHAKVISSKSCLTDQNILLRITSTGLTVYVQRLFNWLDSLLRYQRLSEHTTYVTTWKDYLTDWNILSGKPEALHSPTMLEDAKAIWLIRIFFLKNQRHCTHRLYWNMQRSFDWSEHLSQEIRGTALTTYVGTCKGHLTDQNILSENQRHCTHKLCWKM